jgi:hypothetical protein
MSARSINVTTYLIKISLKIEEAINDRESLKCTVSLLG